MGLIDELVAFKKRSSTCVGMSDRSGLRGPVERHEEVGGGHRTRHEDGPPVYTITVKSPSSRVRIDSLKL